MVDVKRFGKKILVLKFVIGKEILNVVSVTWKMNKSKKNFGKSQIMWFK